MDVRNQVRRNVREEVVYHSDIELVDRIPDNPQENDKEESSDDEDQAELNDANNLEDNSDKYVDIADDSIASEDQDAFMLKRATDTICVNDNFKSSGICSGKNCTNKSKYEDYPVLPNNVIPVNLPFAMKDVVSSFELNHGVEIDVSEDEDLYKLLKIPGKMLYFLQANSKLIETLKKHNKKYKKSEDYTVIPLHGDKEEYVVHPTCLKVREYNVPERFYILTKFNQYNWIVPRGKFFCSIQSV